jgi:hypothetical protein
LATPNYGYEKRQRELAKKQKKQEKLKAKAERKVGDHHDDHAPPDQDGHDQPPGQTPTTPGQA